MPENDNEFRTGYKKPPPHTRFQKGQSGNPKGRAKGSRNALTLLEQILHTQIRVTESGRTRKISKLEAALIQLVNKAVAGDLRALRDVMAFRSILTAMSAEIPRESADERDRASIALLLRRITASQPRDDKDAEVNLPLNSEEEESR
jgi:hypothetical protein